MCIMADNSCREEKIGCKNCYYNNKEKNIIKYEDSVSLLNHIKTIDDTLNKED